MSASPAGYGARRSAPKAKAVRAPEHHNASPARFCRLAHKPGAGAAHQEAQAIPAGGGPLIRVRIGEASHTAPLDLAGADEPHEVLLDPQFGGSRPVNRLGQLQGRTGRFVLDEIEQNLDLSQSDRRPVRLTPPRIVPPVVLGSA